MLTSFGARAITFLGVAPASSAMIEGSASAAASKSASLPIESAQILLESKILVDRLNSSESMHIYVRNAHSDRR